MQQQFAASYPVTPEDTLEKFIESHRLAEYGMVCVARGDRTAAARYCQLSAETYSCWGCHPNTRLFEALYPDD